MVARDTIIIPKFFLFVNNNFKKFRNEDGISCISLLFFFYLNVYIFLLLQLIYARVIPEQFLNQVLFQVNVLQKYVLKYVV